MHATYPAAGEGSVSVVVSCVAERVLMGSQFFPRGGSAHVAGNLARALPAAGVDVRIVCGSVRAATGDARDFYRGLDVHPVDMTAALDAPDPMLAAPPLHPSYEDRPDAPDRVFALARRRRLRAPGRGVGARPAPTRAPRDADVLHLHHLTPAARGRRAGRARTCRSSATCTAPSC